MRKNLAHVLLESFEIQFREDLGSFYVNSLSILQQMEKIIDQRESNEVVWQLYESCFSLCAGVDIDSLGSSVFKNVSLPDYVNFLAAVERLGIVTADLVEGVAKVFQAKLSRPATLKSKDLVRAYFDLISRYQIPELKQNFLRAYFEATSIEFKEDENGEFLVDVETLFGILGPVNVVTLEDSSLKDAIIRHVSGLEFEGLKVQRFRLLQEHLLRKEQSIHTLQCEAAGGAIAALEFKLPSLRKIHIYDLSPSILLSVLSKLLQFLEGFEGEKFSIEIRIKGGIGSSFVDVPTYTSIRNRISDLAKKNTIEFKLITGDSEEGQEYSLERLANEITSACPSS